MDQKEITATNISATKNIYEPILIEQNAGNITVTNLL